MLKLDDFFHLPQLDTLIARLAADTAGLTVVAGLDPRPAIGPAVSDQFLPSGRSAIFRILLAEILAASSPSQVAVVAEDPDAMRIPRRGRRVTTLLVRPEQTYAEQIAAAAA